MQAPSAHRNLGDDSSAGTGASVNSAIANLLQIDGFDLNTNERISTVNLRRVVNYVDRPHLHEQLRARLHDNQDNKFGTSSNVVVVHGLGGAGKTQLVLDYIQRYRREYTGLFWIHATSKRTVEEDVSSVYSLLHKQAFTSGQEKANFDETLLKIKNWFLNRLTGKWLWILDSADNVEDVQDPDFVNLQQLIPDVPSVKTLITTRRSEAANLSSYEAIPVGDLEPEEALLLFWGESGIDQTAESSENQRSAQKIVEELGNFALAVTLAGSVISKSPRMAKNLSIYLQEYSQNRDELLAKKPSKLVTEYGESVLTTWETSYRHLQKSSPVAAKLLAHLALLDGSDIFIDLFEYALRPRKSKKHKSTSIPIVNQKVLNWQKGVFGDQKASVSIIETALSDLKSLSFVKYLQEADSYSMHKLVQVWGYERLDDKAKIDVCCAVTGMMINVYGDCQREPAGGDRVLKHFQKTFQVIANACPSMPCELGLFILKLYRYLFSFFVFLGTVNENVMIARILYQKLAEILGDEHSETIFALEILTRCLRLRLSNDEAALLLYRLLAIRENQEGKNHARTISAMVNLAQVLNNQGRSEKAEELLRDGLERLPKLGTNEQSIILGVKHQLGGLMLDLDHNKEAIAMLKEALECGTQVLGDHSISADIQEKLASALFISERVDESISMMRNLVDRNRRVLGDDHPTTLISTRSLVNFTSNQDHRNSALKSQRDDYERLRQSYGERHLETLNAQSCLIGCLLGQKDFENAAPHARKYYEHTKHRFGRLHSNSLCARVYLSLVLRGFGQEYEALNLLKEIMEEAGRGLDPGDPHFVLFKLALLSNYKCLGCLEEALPLAREVVDRQKQNSGETHQKTLYTMTLLAQTLLGNGFGEEALAVQKDLLEKRRGKLGDGHPDTISAMNVFDGMRSIVERYSPDEMRSIVKRYGRDQALEERSVQ